MFYIFPRAVSKKDCNYFIKYCLNKIKWEKDAMIGDSATADTLLVDYSIRKTDIAFLPVKKDKIHKIILAYIEKANANFFHYKIKGFEPIQFARYQKDGHYDWHQDFSGNPHYQHKDASRKLSLTLSLSNPDTYEGGYLEFFDRELTGGYSEVEIDGVINSKEQVREQVREQGSIIVFDSRDFHRVTPITKGMRYSIVCWSVGPNLV